MCSSDLRAVGVQEIADWLEGRSTREAALAAAQLATRRYAKRQFTWFRNQPPPEWLRTSSTESYPIAGDLEIRLLS